MTVKEFLDSAYEMIPDGWFIAALTDRYIVDKWPLSRGLPDDIETKVLEARIFSASGEIRLSRTDIGKGFSYRAVFDAKEKRDSFDEVQYLDIDEKRGKTEEGKVYTTGGGSYQLPVNRMANAQIKIRYYLGKYPETGQARIEDWRIVEFMEGE